MPDRKKPPAGYAKGIAKANAAARLRAARQERARQARLVRARVPPVVPAGYRTSLRAHRPLTNAQIANIIFLALAYGRRRPITKK
jgi:hypothetical protein